MPGPGPVEKSRQEKHQDIEHQHQIPLHAMLHPIEGTVDILREGQGEGDEEEVEQGPFYREGCHGFTFEVGDDAGGTEDNKGRDGEEDGSDLGLDDGVWELLDGD